jgi:hypothetical protein
MPSADTVSGGGAAGSWRRDQVRAGERELHAGAQRRVHVEVALVGGGEDLVDVREHSRHALRRRW